MDFKKLAENVAHVALDKTMDGKNIGEIAESVAESALETAAKELSTPENTSQVPATASDKTRGNIISSIVSLIGYFLSRLFK